MVLDTRTESYRSSFSPSILFFPSWTRILRVSSKKKVRFWDLSCPSSLSFFRRRVRWARAWEALSISGRSIDENGTNDGICGCRRGSVRGEHECCAEEAPSRRIPSQGVSDIELSKHLTAVSRRWREILTAVLSWMGRQVRSGHTSILTWCCQSQSCCAQAEKQRYDDYYDY